jgi:hypothetical protein
MTASATPEPSVLSGTVQPAPPGVKGFDADTPLSATAARAFRDAGYQFCVRYVGRTAMGDHDLTGAEARTLLDAGLALMVVQHVLDPNWSPTAALGAEYGRNAAAFTRQLGFPTGVNVWCDLEGVVSGANASDVIGYCNAWYDAVAAAGYVPGLYVGYAPGLTAEEIYGALRFQHYWGAYNLDSDQVPATRGLQLKQHRSTGGTVAGITTEWYDDDETMTDALGGQVLWLHPGPVA